MKTRLLLPTALIVVFVAGAANAADLPNLKGPPAYTPPAFSWTGFYVGVNAGAAINDWTGNLDPSGCFISNPPCGGPLTLNPLRSDSYALSGVSFTGGGQAGYNYQIARIVLGIETDINYNSQHESDSVNRLLAAPLSGNFLHSTSDRSDWFGTLRWRAGFLAMPSLLLYATGGLAYGQVASTTSVGFPSTTDTYLGSISRTRAGWTAGAGAEWMFAPSWSAKIEYLHVDLGSASYVDACLTTCALGNTYQSYVRVRDDIVRLGVNYKFDWPAPPVPRE